MLEKLFRKVEKIDPRVILIASIVIMAAHSAIFFNFTLDESYITYRYSENLLSGKGLVFNEGELVEGYSNFTLVILGSMFMMMGDVVFYTKVFMIIAGILTLITVYKLSELLWGKSPYNVIAPILLSCTTIFALWAVGGLETHLFTFLLVVSLYLFIYEERKNTLPFSAITFSILAMTRPDGAIIFVISAAYRFYRILSSGSKPSSSIRYFLLWIVIFSAIYAPYFICRVSYYGSFFPTNFYVKVSNTSSLFPPYLGEFVGFIINAVSIPLLIFAIIPLFVRKINDDDKYLITIGIAVAIIYNYVNGVGVYRHFVQLLPIIFIYVQSGLTTFFKQMKITTPGKLIVMILIIVSLSIPSLPFGNGSLKLMADSYSEGLNNAHIYVGKWLRENAPGDSLIAVGDAGALPFYSRLKTIDLNGLVDKHIAHNFADAEYVLEREPNYIILFTNDKYTDIPKSETGKNIFDREEFHDSYEKIMVRDVGGGVYLNLYKRL